MGQAAKRKEGGDAAFALPLPFAAVAMTLQGARGFARAGQAR